jgi:hypothetical protein
MQATNMFTVFVAASRSLVLAPQRAPRGPNGPHLIEVHMFRALFVSLFATVMTAGCANMQPVTAEDSYCIAETGQSCSELEGSGDCQPCPRTASAVASAVAPVALSARPD